MNKNREKKSQIEKKNDFFSRFQKCEKIAKKKKS